MGTGDILLEGNPAIMSRVRGRGVAVLLGMLQDWEQGGGGSMLHAEETRKSSGHLSL